MRDTQIILVELLAPLLAMKTWQKFLRGRTALFFNDSSSAENILIKGYSNKALDANSVASQFWGLSSSLDMTTYTDRVPTDMNPSDGCSRGTALEDCLAFDWELCRVRLDPEWSERGPGQW